MNVTAEQLNAWEKRLDSCGTRLHDISQDLCSCQLRVADDLDLRCDELIEIQKEIHLAWVDLIAREQT